MTGRALKMPHARWPMFGLVSRNGTARLADQMAGVIYGWAILKATGDSMASGLVVAAVFAGLFIGALCTGPLVARFGARSVAIIGAWVSAASAVAIALLFAVGETSPWAVALLAGLGAVLDTPGAVAAESRYPEVARLARTRIVGLNASNEALDHGAGLVAPAVAALLVASHGPAWAATVLAAFATISAMLMSVSFPRFRESQRPLQQAKLSETFRFIATHRVIGPLAALLSLLVAGLTTMQLIVVPRLLIGEAGSETGLATFMFASGLAGLAGAGITGALGHRFSLRIVTSLSLLLFAAGPAALLANLPGMLVVAALATGMGVGLLAPLVSSLLQTTPAKNQRAQVQSLSYALMLAATPPIILGAGYATDAFPLTMVLYGLGLVFASLALITLVVLPRAALTGKERKIDHAGSIRDDQAPTPAPLSVSLARLSLVYEWRRYLAAVLAVAFSGLLVIVQLGLLLGLFRTVTTVVDRSGADLWVGEATAQSFDLARELPERIEFQVRSQPGVASVERFHQTFADWRTPDGRRVAITLIGLNTAEGSLAFPRGADDSLRRALMEPGAVLVDAADRGKLGLEDAAGTPEINGKRVRVAGALTGFKAIGGAMVFVSEATFRELRGGAGRDSSAQFFLARLAPGHDVEAVQARITEAGNGQTRAMTVSELSTMSQTYWLLESGTGVGFLFSTVLGLLVGVAITSQTLRGAVLASLREYATLRALGLPLSALRAVVLEQSFWVGVTGLLVTAIATALVHFVATSADVAIALTWWACAGTAIFTLAVSLISGLLSLGPLFRTEPAELLR